MRRLHRTSTMSALAALAVLGGAACAGPSVPHRAEPAPVPVAATHLQLPLDRYLLSVPQQERVGTARVVLLNACLREHSLPARVDLPRPAGPRSWNERRYGITDRSLAARYGYGLGGCDPRRLPPRHRTAVPTECLAAARHRLAPVAVPDPLLAQRLSAEGYGRSRADARVTAAVRAWSWCMRASGHRYADPLQPLGDPHVSGDGSTAVAAALADVSCKTTTDLIGVWSSVEAGHQRRLIAAHGPALAALEQAIRRQLAAADAVLGASAG